MRFSMEGKAIELRFFQGKPSTVISTKKRKLKNGYHVVIKTFFLESVQISIPSSPMDL